MATLKLGMKLLQGQTRAQRHSNFKDRIALIYVKEGEEHSRRATNSGAPKMHLTYKRM